MIRALRWIIVLAVLAVLGGVSFFSRFFTDLWWFQNLGYSATFWVQVAWQWGVRVGAGLLAAAFIYSNLWLTRRAASQALFRYQEQLPAGANQKALKWGFFLASLALGALYGSAVAPMWERIALFLNSQPFGVVDPIFSRDVGFYVFSLPFFSLVNSLAMGLAILALLSAGAVYFLTGSFQIEGFKVQLSGTARWHLSLLLAGVLFLKAWGYFLNLYELLYSSSGLVFGPTYTNIVANRPALYILAVLAALIGLGVLFNAFRPGAGRWIVAGVLTLGVASVALGGFYPNIVQQLRVEPNQLKLEQPYIQNHIAMTRAAYGLNKIAEREFAASPTLTAADLTENSETIRNIRLWDWDTLLKAYRQLQEFKNYYRFVDVDVDRYYVDGVYTEVMIAARELNPSRLMNQWINQHLQYTHGYGVVASPVNRVTTEGLPEFLVADIPPQGIPELRVDRPELYYGEMGDSQIEYVIANTGAKEFDYPSGDNDVFTSYAGHGGVQLSNYLRRLAFAARFGTTKILLSTDLSVQSRVLMYRDIGERVRRIAPFLSYDYDPYIVVDEGKLYWIQDAYTTTDRFPYSRPTQGLGNQRFNYIRNSVKVVVDAYNGDVTFYLADETDPIAKALTQVYKVPFRSLEEMPGGLRAHLRYPEELFEVQSELFAIYHMTDTQVYYNRTDAWAIPTATSGNGQQPPYYVIAKLPGEDQEELVLLRAYTPVNRSNMTAWLAARNDGENYGEMVLFKFPDESLTFGPAQIEARIDQDSDISQLLTLWGQRGSQVIRGNLIVIPVGDSLLYVEPIFLQAEQSQMPELKRVVAVHGTQVALGLNLDEALAQLVGGKVAADAEPSDPAEALPARVLGSEVDVEQIKVLYGRVEQSLRDGDWASFGDAMKQLSEAINKLEAEETP